MKLFIVLALVLSLAAALQPSEDPHTAETKVAAAKLTAGAALKKGALVAGKVLLAPITLTAAKTSAILGKVLTIGGMKFAVLGSKVALIGGKTAAAGVGLKALSAGIAKHMLGGWILIPHLPSLASLAKLGWMKSDVGTGNAGWVNLGTGNVGEDGEQYLIDTPYVQVYKNVLMAPEPTIKDKKQDHKDLKGKDVGESLPIVEIAGKSEEDILFDSEVQDDVHQLDSDEEFIPEVEEENPIVVEEQDPIVVESEVRRKRSVGSRPVLPFSRAMRLLHAIDIKECIARVICELSCDLKAFGKEGQEVFNNLMRLQTSGHARSPDLKVFREALVRGRRYAVSRRNFGEKSCGKCATVAYRKCEAETKDLVSVAAMIRVE